MSTFHLPPLSNQLYGSCLAAARLVSERQRAGGEHSRKGSGQLRGFAEAVSGGKPAYGQGAGAPEARPRPARAEHREEQLARGGMRVRERHSDVNKTNLALCVWFRFSSHLTVRSAHRRPATFTAGINFHPVAQPTRSRYSRGMCSRCSSRFTLSLMERSQASSRLGASRAIGRHLYLSSWTKLVVVVVVVVVTLTRMITPAVTGQAPVILEWNNTRGKKTNPIQNW